MSEMFIEKKPELIQVLETPTLIPTPEKVKKPRKPMSDERKAQLREQLAKARETKKAKKLATVQVGGHSVPEVEDKPLKVKKTKERNIAPSIPLTILEEVDDMDDLKKQLAELKKNNKKHQRDLITQAIDFENQKKIGQNHIQKKNDEKVIKRKAKALPAELVELAEEPHIEEAIAPPPPQPAARYATYKKSIWSDLK